jgi:hypothetical protein
MDMLEVCMSKITKRNIMSKKKNVLVDYHIYTSMELNKKELQEICATIYEIARKKKLRIHIEEI